MKKKLTKILGVSLTVMLLASLVVVTTPASAADDDWGSFYPPTSSSLLGRQLAPHSTPADYVGGPIAQAIDGTLYAYVLTTQTTTSLLFSSTSEGHKWSETGKQLDPIVDIACSPTDDDVIYIATATEVRGSIDGGATFITKVSLSGENITSIDVGMLGGNHMVVIGTTAASYGGKVYLYNEAAYPIALAEMDSSINILAVALSPNFSDDQGIFTVGTSNATTLQIKNKIGGALWGTSLANITATANATTTASIAFPEGFDTTVVGDANWYIGFDGGGPDEGVWLIQGYLGTSFKALVSAQKDIASLAVSGGAGTSTRILAGLTDGTIMYTDNGGDSWKTDSATGLKKQPTGTSNALVLMDSDFESSGQAWSATSGVEGGISITNNFGTSWNQVGLVNTGSQSIVDVSVMDGTVFIAAFAATDNYSIWRHDGSWERVLCETLVSATELRMVEVSPDYDNDSTVFASNWGARDIWRSTDGGDIWVQQRPVLADIAKAAWVVVSPSELIVGCDDEYTYRTANNGLTWIQSNTDLGDTPYSIAMSPTTAGAFLLGDDAGDCYYTTNSGETWTNSSPSYVSGNMTVAYAPDGKTRWATSDAGGVYRYSSPSWKQVDNLNYTGVDSDNVSIGTGIVFGSDGTVYVTDSDDGTVSRSLPGKTDGGNMGSTTGPNVDRPYFEIMSAIENPSGSAMGLWLTGDNKLWTIAYSTYYLNTYVDSLSVPVTGLTATPGGTIATLGWDELGSATSYTYQVNTREDFLGMSALPNAVASANTTLGTIPVADLTEGTTYYWKVRGAAPVLSLWSDTVSFSTVMGVADISADYGAPRPGATDVPTDVVFTWKDVAGATGYQFQLTEDQTFYATPTLLLEDATTTTNTYVAAGLAYSTIYYWRVKAIGATSESAWVNGVFTTTARPEEAAEPIVITEPGEPGEVTIVEVPVERLVEQPIPSYLLWSVIAIGAVLIIALIVLIVRTRRVA